MREAPPLVRRALGLAHELAFGRSCIPEVGHLLHALAAQHGRGRVGEIGTGAGVGAAWIVSALDPAVPFVTVERDETLAGVAAELFAGDERVTVLAGDWHALMPPEAPFDLLFYDAAKQRPDLDGEQVVRLLAPGGTVVLDDLTPGRPGPDPVRDFWLGHPELAAVELAVSPTMAVIVAVRAR